MFSRKLYVKLIINVLDDNLLLSIHFFLSKYSYIFLGQSHKLKANEESPSNHIPYVKNEEKIWLCIGSHVTYLAPSYWYLFICLLQNFKMYSDNFLHCVLTLYCTNSSLHSFSGHNLRWALFVYRLIVATLIGNFFWWSLLKLKLKFWLNVSYMAFYAVKGFIFAHL